MDENNKLCTVNLVAMKIQVVFLLVGLPEIYQMSFQFSFVQRDDFENYYRSWELDLKMVYGRAHVMEY